MLRHIPITLLVVVFLSGFAYAQSQPTPNPQAISGPSQANGQKTDESPRSSERGTEQMPFVIKIQNGPNENESVANKENENKHIENEGRLVNFTKQLAIATDELVRATQRLFYATAALVATTAFALWIGGLQYCQIKRTNEQAKVSERAYVFAKVMLKQELIHTPSGNSISPICVRFVNRGKSPAMIEKIRAYPVLAATAPNELTCTADSERTLPKGLAIASDRMWEEEVDVRISNKEWGRIEGLELFVYVVGLIEYKDIHGDKHETGFCWHYRNHRGKSEFIISPKTDLNHHN